VLAGRATCLHETSTTPTKVVAVDLSDGSMETLYDPNPEWRNIELTAVEKIEWTNEFGNSRYGHLVYPRGFQEGVRYPLVVTPYLSSGFLRGDVGDEYPIHLFAHAGLMVLDIALLRRPDVGPVEQEAMNLAGVLAAFDSLDQRGLIDRACIGMTGLSAAARSVNYALINSDVVAAAAVSNLVTPEAEYYLGTAYLRDMLREHVFGGSPLSGSEYYDRLSLVRNADSVAAPVLVNVSDEEFVISFPAFAALEDVGNPVEMHVFPGEYHQKWQPVHRLNIYRRNVQWFEFWFVGREDPEPVDPAQYERWRELRERHEARGGAVCPLSMSGR
jgi:dipeptidyl aminopeptidase/acylaminoacyl peptidase